MAHQDVRTTNKTKLKNSFFYQDYLVCRFRRKFDMLKIELARIDSLHVLKLAKDSTRIPKISKLVLIIIKSGLHGR